MKKLTYIILLLTAALQSVAQERLKVKITDATKPVELKAKLVHGSINISGYDSDEVIVTVNEGIKKTPRGPQMVDGMHRIEKSSSFEINLEEKNNTVTISSSHPNQRIGLEIKVPRVSNLNVGTVNDGAVKIDNITGDIVATNVNGAIVITNVNGVVSANTINGAVKVQFNQIKNEPMAFSTLNGSIDISLPASANINAKMNSDNGEIYSDFEISILPSENKPSQSNVYGMQKIKKEGWTRGRIGKGGADFLMKTSNGNIYIRKN